MKNNMNKYKAAQTAIKVLPFAALVLLFGIFLAVVSAKGYRLDMYLQIVFNEGVVLAVVATGAIFIYTLGTFDISLGAGNLVFCNHGCGYLQYYTECGVNDPGNLCKRSCMFPCKFPAGFGISYSSICYYSCHDVCAFCDCLTDRYHKGWCTWWDQYSGSSGKAV